MIPRVIDSEMDRSPFMNDADNSLRSYDFSSAFLKKMWGTVGGLVCEAILGFFDNEALSSNLTTL